MTSWSRRGATRSIRSRSFSPPLSSVDLQLVWLPAGDPALKGARALYDDQGGTICCEQELDAATRALLVAHEIGHADLHAGSAVCASADIDPSRSTEAAPVGLQRVEDYGARERRELQANVYARELVLPRGVARDLHVARGMTASAIADRTKLPMPLVRQQLFDALLLPPLSDIESERPADVGRRRGPTRRKIAPPRIAAAVSTAGRPRYGQDANLGQAGAVLAGRRHRPGGHPRPDILQPGGRRTLRTLIAAAPEAAPRLWIGTFHAFGLDLVRRYHDKLGLPPDPSLFDRSDAIEVLEEILPTLPLVHYRNLWDPAMVLRDIVDRHLARQGRARRSRTLSRSGARRCEDRGAATRRRGSRPQKCLEVADIYDLYEKALRKHGGVDFGDIIMRPALLLEVGCSASHRRSAAASPRACRRIPRRQSRQRPSAESRSPATAAAMGRRRSRQSIYRFRGASSENMVAFRRRLSRRGSRPARDQLPLDRTNRAHASSRGAADGRLRRDAASRARVGSRRRVRAV